MTDRTTANTANTANTAESVRSHTHPASIILSLLFDTYFASAQPNILALCADLDLISTLLSEANTHVRTADKLSLDLFNTLDELEVSSHANP